VDAPGGGTYTIEWRPKFARDASTVAASLPDDGLDLTGLAGALERQPTGGISRSYRVAEFTQAADPGQTAVADYLRRAPGGGRGELWVLGASAGQTRRLAEAFGRADAATRFATADLSVPAAIDLDRGLLRACTFDLVVIDAWTTALTAASWALLRRLLLPGGLVLVRHPNPGFVHPGPGWSKVGTGPHGGVWAAPPGLFDDGAAELEGPRWVLAGDAYLGQLWAGQGARRVTPSGWLWSYEAQQELRALRAIDFFGDLGDLVGPSGDLSGSSCRDPLGTQVVTRFLTLLRALTAAREGQACPPCRLTIITRRAALDVPSPREALLWAAARALGRELDPGLRIDLRLVDIGGREDLPKLRWLARHDVRERALAVRKGRLYALRLVRRPRKPANAATPGSVAAPGSVAKPGSAAAPGSVAAPGSAATPG
jgi:SAM-dependent methyltransferase